MIREHAVDFAKRIAWFFHADRFEVRPLTPAERSIERVRELARTQKEEIVRSMRE